MLCAFLASTSAPHTSSSRSAFVQDAHCRSWPGLQAVKGWRSDRAWLSEDIRRVNDNLGESHVTVGQLPEFEGVGVEVTRKLVQGDKIKDVVTVEWERSEKYDLIAQEMVELYSELQDGLNCKRHSNRVEHLGHGVWVQYNDHGLDTDAIEGKTATITREESRSCVHHALDALQNRFRVAVTGQPGIGKTRGSMMYAIQCLLHRQAAVLYVGYKSRKMLLFLPGEDSTYRIWRSKSTGFDQTRFQDDPRVVAVIDPPEEGPYSSMGECRIIKFVSNNAEKHFRNWEKDGILLVTSMPTEEEVVAMTTVLWDEEKSPHPWQISELIMMEQKMSEVEKRIELVGAIPRLVFNSRLFRNAIKKGRQGATEAAETLSDSDLYMALRAKYSPLLEKHHASASGGLFFLAPNEVEHTTWTQRIDHDSTFQLTPIAAHILRHRLLKNIEKSRNIPFEDLAYNVLCERTSLQPDTDRVGESTFEEGFRRLVSLQPDAGMLFRPGARCFPLIDYASGTTVWYNAKSADAEKAAVVIKHKGALRFLQEMEKYMLEVYSRDVICEILKRDPPTLTVVTNSDMRAMLDKEVDLSLFSVPVRIKVMNLRERTAEKLLDGMDRTKKLLQEWDQQQLRWKTV